MPHVQQTPASGEIKRYSLPEIFLKAVLQQFSGILDVENEDVTKLMYFKNGQVVFVESNDREETFGHYLMRKKLIDPKSLTEALQELANQKDLKLGEVLLKKGLINPNSLMEQLNLHQEEKLLNAFAIKTGTFRFLENVEWPDYVTVFPFRTLSVFFTAVEKHVTLDEIAEYTSIHPQSKIQLNFQPSRDIPLPPFATRLLNSLNRELITVDQLAAKISVPVGKVIMYLFTFCLADWITVQQTGTKEFVSADGESEQKKRIPDEKMTDEQAMVEKKDINPALAQRIEIEYQKIEALNFYQMFGVGPKFTTQQIQINFFQIISEYKRYETHPKGKEIVNWIKTAYDVLKDPKLRAIYDYRFGFRKKNTNMEAAEKVFYRALKLIETGDIETAKSLLQKINEKVTDSTYRAYLGWVIFKDSPQKNMSDVMKYLDEAFKIYPADPFAHYLAGQVEQHKKNYAKAQGHFRSALQVYPGYTEAAAALDHSKFEKTNERFIGKEKQKKEKAGFFDLSVGGFSFGKKE